MSGSPRKGCLFLQNTLTFLPTGKMVWILCLLQRDPSGNSRDSSGLSCLCTCKRGVQRLGGLIRKGKNALLASRLWGVSHPFQKLTQTMPCFHRAGSELCVQQLLRAHGAARAPQGAAATHQTVDLCQSSRHWANSLRSAAGELPTETKGKRYH